MSQNICNICGANYEYIAGRWKCPACGAYKTEELSNEEVTLLYNANQKLRLSDFDEAEKSFSDIIEKYPKNPNGYWGRLLSKYGIKYEDDFDGRKIPTCYATSIESVMSDKDYHKAIELADADTKAYYQKQAEYIERVRKEWVEKARKEKPYDIFLCYKDSDLANGIDRTKDSVAVQELYIHLTKQGYRVFFSRESLRDKVGEKYEPYIFNALSTAKVMLVYGSSAEYITSTWLKNEWTRYEKRLRAGEKKPNSLLVACDGFSPNELPKALSSMQCFDATKPSFYSDLDAVVKKLIKGEEKPKAEAPAQPQNKIKKLPIAIASAAALVVIILCILLPNILGGNTSASITDSKHGVVITADSEIFDKNTSFIVDKLSSGSHFTSMVTAVNTTKSVDIQNAVIYDIECDTDLTGNVSVKVAYTKAHTDSTVKVYYVSDDKTLIEEHACTYKNGTVEFKTNHLSYYVIGEIVSPKTPSGDNTGDNNEQKPDDNQGGNTPGTGDNTGNSGNNQGSGNEDNPTQPKTVNITFNANGGSGTMSYQTVTVGVQSILNECTFTRDGYMFAGWATSVGGTTEYTDGASITVNTENAVSLYAIWVPNSNSLIFNANGGSGYMESVSIETNQTIALPANAFTKSGYTFAGWSDVQGGDVKYTDSGSFKMTSSASVTLYAVWTANTNSVVLKANNGTNNETTINLKTDETKNLPTNTFTKVGYTFVGWSSSSNGSVEYADGASFTMGDSSVTLYAIWEANNNSIIFNANGGSGTMSAQQAKTNEKVNLNQNTFTREGYTFAGWATSSSGNAAYADQAAYTVGTNAEYTLYAVWIKAAYTITYHMNGGSNNISNPAGYDVTDATITLANPERDGYTFLGWFSESTFQNRVTSIPTGSTGNKAFYASWSANTNTINFNANGGSGNMSAQQAKTDEVINLTQNAFTRDGYTFKGWSTSANGTIVYADKTEYTMGSNASVTLYAVWEANTNTAYIVKHHQQNIDNDQYTLIDTQTLYGTTDSSVTPSTKTYTGFVSPTTQTITILPDGSAIVDYYYNRQIVTLTFVTNGGDAIDSISRKYGSTVILPDATKYGYTFGGWFTEEALKNQKTSLAVTENITVFAWWEEENKAGDFTYSIYDDYVTISGYKGTSTTMIVPSFIGGVAVKNIAASAFVGKADLRKVVIPNGIETIGYGAFHGCSALEEMTLPFVGQCLDNQFADTNTLFCYIFGSSKFANSVAASQINPASGGSNTYYLPSSLTKVNITGGYLRHGAFSGCTNIQVVTLSNIKAFEERVFYNCSGLTTVNVPAGITSIPSAFESCTSLTNVTLPSGLKSIKGAFTWCVSLTTINLPDSIEDIEGAFACSGITNIVIPPKVKDISSTFYYCGSLTSIEIPNTVTSIGSSAFMESGLTSISLPESIQSIGSHAFYGCNNLESISIPSKVSNIGNFAFANCTSLKNIYITDLNKWCNIQFGETTSNPLVYGGTLFLNNVAVTTLANCNVSTISPYAFYMYEKFSSITIPDTVTEIGAHTFEGCPNLQTVTINNSVVSIGDSAFGYCDKLTVYCEMAIKPSGWSDSWNKGQYSDSGCDVVWFYKGDIWDGTKASAFAGGSGIETDPYLISTAEQLAYLISSSGSSGKYYLLTTNINLMKLEWQKISSTNTFYGYFDGGNHTIYNLNIQDSNMMCYGLFAQISGGYVKNLNLIDAVINADGYNMGILCGSVSSTSIIENCYVQGCITTITDKTSACVIGGIVGDCTGSISRCGANVDIVANSPAALTVGGIAGECGLGKIENCYSEGNIELQEGTKHFLGGIVGLYGWTTTENNLISNCYSKINLTSNAQTNSCVGGIVGSLRFETQIKNCFSTGDLSAIVTTKKVNYSQLGRVVGYENDSGTTLTNCYADSSQSCNRGGTDSTSSEPTNSYESLKNTQTLQSESFIYTTLGWNSDIWQINEGGFPTLK